MTNQNQNKPLSEMSFDELMDEYDVQQHSYEEQALIEAELRRRIEAGETLRASVIELVRSWTAQASASTDGKGSTLALCALELGALLNRSGQFAAVKVDKSEKESV